MTQVELWARLRFSETVEQNFRRPLPGGRSMTLAVQLFNVKLVVEDGLTYEDQW